MLVKNLLKKGRGAVATVGIEAKVPEAAALLRAQHIDVVVVCDAGQKVIGIINNSDIMRGIVSCNDGVCFCDTGVSQIMARQFLSCRPNDNIDDVRSLMVDQSSRRMPVVNNKGQFIGLISLRDVLFHLFEKAKFKEDELEHYFYGVGYR